MAESDVSRISDDRLIEMVRLMGDQVPPVTLELANRLEECSVRLQAARKAVGTEDLVGILNGTVPVDTTVGVAEQLASHAASVDDARVRGMLEELVHQLVAPTLPALPAAA